MRARRLAAGSFGRPLTAVWFLLALGSIAICGPHPAHARDWPKALDPYVGRISPGFQAWMAGHFALYAKAFIRADGRVVDAENGHITHSEAIGYPMLLAATANDRATFDRVWTFARNNMQRPDGLISWVWDPNALPHVRDTNNATDGDMKIATALYAGALRWGEPAYWQEGVRIAEAIGENLIVLFEDRRLLLPGIEGFAEVRRGTGADGRPRMVATRSPVINTSYWIFFTFPALAELAPNHPWRLVAADGLYLLHGSTDVPTEWSNLRSGRGVWPAVGRPAEFSYNAVRIPLFLLHSGIDIADFNERLLRVWGEPGRARPFSFAIPGNRRITNMTDPGYRLIHQLMWCVETDRPVDIELFAFRPTTYFASSLHLLAFNAIYVYSPRCVPN